MLYTYKYTCISTYLILFVCILHDCFLDSPRYFQAHKEGRIQLLGVAVTGGNCFVEAGVRCTRKILDLAGLDEEVEVRDGRIRLREHASVCVLVNNESVL